MNTIQIEIWQLGTLFLGFIAILSAAGKVLLQQIDKRLDMRFASMDEARAQMAKDQEKNTEAWRNLERDFLKFRGDLPLEYVRREDFIRNQSVIEAKLDGLALHFQNMQLRTMKNDRSE